MTADRVVELRQAALAYHDKGMFVLPVSEGTKRPMVKWGQGSKRLGKEALSKFWRDGDERPPDIGVKLGADTLVLDLDPKNEPQVEGAFKDLLSDTLCDTTPSGGLHAWYQIDTKRRPQVFRGMDVLTAGRMTLVPPSTGYERVGKPKVKRLPKPDVLIKRVCIQAGIKEESASVSLAKDALGSLEPIPIHRRNQTLVAIAGVLRSAGFRGNRLEGAIEGLARTCVETKANDPLTMEEITAMCESIDWRNPKPFETHQFTKYQFNTSEQPPPLKWLIHDLLPAEGVTSLFGMGKQGKSYMGMEMYHCLVTGQPFLELTIMKKAGGRPVRVLYVDWERRGDSLKRRMHALAADGQQFDVDVIEPQGALVHMTETLRAEIALGGYDLMVLDSLTISLMQGDVNDSSTVVPAMFALNAVGCPVLALDHTRKPQQGDTYESLSAFGSVFKGNVCSMNWQMEKTGGDAVGMNVRMRHVTNNFDTKPPDIFARIAFEKSIVGLEKATIERVEDDSDENQIAKWLGETAAVGGETVDEIAQRTGLTQMQVARNLQKLHSDGRATVEDDHWTLATVTQAFDEDEDGT